MGLSVLEAPQSTMTGPLTQSEQLLLPDLTACEREPIHVPGAIEPHGALFVVDKSDLKVLQTSANTRRPLAEHSIARDSFLLSQARGYVAALPGQRRHTRP